MTNTNRLSIALLSLATLGAMAWFGYWMLPQRLLFPGFMPFFISFFGGLALPYLLIIGLLARRRDHDGTRLAFATALINSIWVLPLAGLLILFGGFTMGNRDQLHSIVAVATGALLQILLFAVAGRALWRSRKDDAAARAKALPAGNAWLLATLVPVLASGGSLLYFDWQLKEYQARSTRATANSRAAQETINMLQDCLTKSRETGYPPRLDVCGELAPRMTESSGYRFEYLPALPGEDGRIGAYQLCAQPLAFRATGFDTVVANSTGSTGAGVIEFANLANPPTCASVLGVEMAIAWCAYAHAARDPSRSYPAHLAEIGACVMAGRRSVTMTGDRLGDGKDGIYAYLADAPEASGRIVRFRIYRLGLAGDRALYIDEQLQASAKKVPASGPVIGGLPAQAVPERFAPGCDAGRGEDCFVAGYEWQRKAHQAGGERVAAAVPMLAAALEAFARGCELDNARSCTWLALEDERGNDRPVLRVVELYEKGCRLGDVSGCRHAGQMYESGRKSHVQTLQSPSPPLPPLPDLARDVARAVALHGRACELGDRDACFIAGRLLAAGEGMAPDPEKALSFFAQACSEGMAFACARAAALSPRQEAFFRHRACVFGSPGDCR